MRCLLLTDGESDFSAVLESCGIPITRMSLEDAAKEELSIYDTTQFLPTERCLIRVFVSVLKQKVPKGNAAWQCQMLL